ARALERARVIAAMVDTFGSWVSQYRGVWVLNDPHDPAPVLGEFLDHRQAHAELEGGGDSNAASLDSRLSVDIAQTRATFHRKVPSLVQRELAVERSRLLPDARV